MFGTHAYLHTVIWDMVANNTVELVHATTSWQSTDFFTKTRLGETFWRHAFALISRRKPWDGVKSIRDDISRNCHVNVGDTVTPCVEVVAVWTVPGAVSSGCILAEPRKGDKLTPGGNESG